MIKSSSLCPHRPGKGSSYNRCLGGGRRRCQRGGRRRRKEGPGRGTLKVPLDELAMSHMLIGPAPQDRQVVAFRVCARELHVAARVAVNLQGFPTSNPVGKLDRPRVMIGRHMLCILLVLGQRAAEKVVADTEPVPHGCCILLKICGGIAVVVISTGDRVDDVEKGEGIKEKSMFV